MVFVYEWYIVGDFKYHWVTEYIATAQITVMWMIIDYNQAILFTVYRMLTGHINLVVITLAT